MSKKNDLSHLLKKDKEGVLEVGMPHPGAYIARQYLEEVGPGVLKSWMNTFELMAKEAVKNGERNAVAEISYHTLKRMFDEKLKVSDRYVMGLAWMILDQERKGAQESSQIIRGCV